MIYWDEDALLVKIKQKDIEPMFLHSHETLVLVYR